MPVATRAVGVEWARRNIGIDYAAEDEVRHLAGVKYAGGSIASDRALRPELIDFDSESPQRTAFRSLATAAPHGLAKFVEVKSPKGLEPKPGKKLVDTSLPKADVLIVTWAVDEGHGSHASSRPAMTAARSPVSSTRTTGSPTGRTSRRSRHRCAPAAPLGTPVGWAPTGRARSAVCWAIAATI